MIVANDRFINDTANTTIVIKLDCFIGTCICKHVIASVNMQLKPCRVFCLLFLHGTTDADWEFILHGCIFGFKMLNVGCQTSYVACFRPPLEDDKKK